MAEPLKNIFNAEFMQDLSDKIERILPAFDSKKFNERIFDKTWDKLELKDRMNRVATILTEQLKMPYPKTVQTLIQFVDMIESDPKTASWGYMFIPDIIKDYGQDDLKTSLFAMERITQFTSCEFAVRPFLLKYPKEMMAQMLKWSKHEHQNVRRFSSEGCRPRLPWAEALPFLKSDPSPIFPILENLKNDTSEFVRKSVANNLNDISKDHPNKILELTENWAGKSKETDWTIKHGCRTLLKQGNQKALQLFGLEANPYMKIMDFQIITPFVQLGENLKFTFILKNSDTKNHRVRIEYGLYYLRANGSLSKKVFKISENTFAANTQVLIERKQSFRIITTRTFYPGAHKLSIIINGKELGIKEFNLKN